MGYPDAFGPAERVELGERIERSGEFDGTELLLGIEVDGRLVGEMQARQPRMGAAARACSSSGSICSTPPTADKASAARR